MVGSAALLALIVNDPALLPCLLQRHGEESWLRPTDGFKDYGIGRYVSGKLLLQIRPGKQQEDVPLAALASGDEASLIIAHASPVLLSAPNHSGVQPIRYRDWLYAQSREPGLELPQDEETGVLPKFLLRARRGEQAADVLFTDFLALIGSGRLFDSRRADLKEQALRLKDAVEQAKARTSVLVASRRGLLAYQSGEPLYYCRTEGLEECQRCGLGGDSQRQGPLQDSHRMFKGLWISNRPFESAGEWQQIPEGQVLAVSSTLEVWLAPRDN